MPNIKSYISQLKYDKALNNGPLTGYLTNPRFIFLAIFAILITGIYSFIQLPRTLNPDVEIPLVIVQTSLPGASPTEIENLVTDPIEDKIQNMEIQVPIATIKVEKKCALGPTRPQPNSMMPRKPASKKKAVSTS